MSQPQSIGDVIDTRRRSRSKTPGMMNLRVSSERELNGLETSPGRKVRKPPTVGVIAEEEPSAAAGVVQKSATPTQARSNPARTARNVTSDYSSEDISPDRARQAATAVAANAQLSKAMSQLTQSTVNTTTTTKTVQETTVVIGGGKETVSTRQTITQSSTNNSATNADDKERTTTTTAAGKETLSTSPKKDADGVQKVQTHSTATRSSKASVTAAAAVIRTSTPKNAAQKLASAKVILTPEELQQHAAYKEYLEAGEYWNKYPKTDYTYSELSPHRREVAPGLVAMPNMSRPSLNKHAERVQTMIERNPEQEAYIRERYTSARSRLIRSNPYDSNDESDGRLSQSRSSNTHRQQHRATIEQRSIVSRFFLSIVTLCFTCVDSVRSVFRRREEHHMYYTRIEDERGFFARVSDGMMSFFVNVFKRIYLFISSVLFLDAWLLQTAAANSEQQLQRGQRKRRFLLFLLVLLPFLLIGAFLLADEDQTIVLPASSRATLALSSLSRILPSNLRQSDPDVEYFYRLLSEQNANLREKLVSATAFLPTVSSLFGWPWSWMGGGGASRKDTPYPEAIRATLQRTLSKEEFEELMRYIDGYIDGVMEQKYASTVARLTTESLAKSVAPPEITVAQVIEESLRSYNYQLTDGDVDRVAQSVQQSLRANYPRLFDQAAATSKDGSSNVALSKEYIAEIQRLVEQHITVQNNRYVIGGPQLEEILARILSSDRLSALIDQRIAGAVQSEARAVAAEQRDREALVDDLRKELTDIKTHFSEQLLSSSAQWDERLQLVRQDQALFEQQLKAYRLESDKLYQTLLADIDNRLNALREERYEGVNRVVRENIITILGLSVKQDIADGDLRAWLNGLFVARDELERRLVELQAKVTVDVREEIERTAGRLMKEVGEQLRVEMMVRLREEAQAAAGGDGDPAPTTTTTSTSNLTEDDVKRIVRDALVVYDADKTGMVDYALESAGGQVLSTRCTESYQASSAEFRIFGIIPIWYPSNTPRTVISPTMEPGQCWAFQGFPGYLVIQLNTEILVTGFTLEHISKLLVSNGSISSAPKHFTVWGLVALNDPEPVLLGSYEYLDQLGSSVQYFPVQNRDWQRPLQIVELRIESNHGNIHYTCLYRFRVHGDKP
ncbi:LOW QUALITY PROTEIN: uncharacterized protein LOC118514491 [Anopheles stephensi]|uniref:LOW QUALITY PROTEIN: uncharacterized protein LOC118514491 n=1 Tax=Anopheles stephensi TaxID=30069 RepID=UPI0016587C62|nr:LOW QUALITY PROTEIN: uncharacterized protein LOC118514491 [Anopheles stephensi]